MTKLKEILNIIFRKDESKMKEKWSLKKKLLLAAGGIGAALVGLFAYGKMQDTDVEQDDSEDEYFDYSANDSEDDIEESEVEAETQEV